MTKYLFTTWTEEKNCWWLVRDFYQFELGIDLPHYADYCSPVARARLFKEHLSAGDWVAIEEPENYSLVAMGRAGRISHVGLWLSECSKVLHLIQNSTGRVEPLSAISKHFSTIRFYRYEAPNCPRP